MAKLRFGRPISLRWNGLLLEGPANTVFEIPDEYYEEFNQDIGSVEPSIVWVDPDEGFSLRARVTLLEEGSSGIPQTLVDYKGDLITATADNTVARLAVGTNGKVLTANSATATGLEWQTPSDDIPVSIVDAKGDLVIGTANNTVARFGVGTNGQVLTADSNQADGLVWTTPAGGVSLGSASPASLGTAAAGTSSNASHEDHVHSTTGLALSGHDHTGVYATSGHDHTGVYETSGTAAAAVSAHEALADPHPGSGVISVTAPLVNSGTASAADLSIVDATTAVKGAVQLTDSISSTSTTTAATPNSVKSAYDLANGAVAKSTITTTGDIIYASAANTPARLGIGTASQVLSVAAGVPAWTTLSAGGGILKYEEFTSSGSFVIPENASSSAIIVLEMIGAANGGNGGDNRGSGTAAAGGYGGNGAHFGVWSDLVSTYGTAGGTVTVTIGAGGAGGTGTSVTGGTGGFGADGGDTLFGSAKIPGQRRLNNDTRAAANYGSGIDYISGVYPTANVASGTGKPPVYGSIGLLLGGFGGYANSGAFYSGADNEIGGAGGGGGGYITSANVFQRGGNGGKTYPKGQAFSHAADSDPSLTFGNGGVGGTTQGAAGGTASASGGGGGASSTTGNGGAGGAGGVGCGGGGGGAARTGSTSGAGGAGGSGRVRVWVIG